jgi:hypothetical protein
VNGRANITVVNAWAREKKRSFAGVKDKMPERLTTMRNCLRPIAIARNAAALIVTLGGAAFVMFAPWWWQGMCDLLYVSLCAGVVGFAAAMLGRCNGVVWYGVWMLGLLVCDEINNAPDGDPELMLGAVLSGMAALPMIPLGVLANYLKNRKYKYTRCLEN